MFFMSMAWENIFGKNVKDNIGTIWKCNGNGFQNGKK